MKKNGLIVIYAPEKGKSQIEVKLEDETVWLSQVQMQELFGQTKQGISLHIKNIYKEGELIKNSTVKESLTVRKEGKRLIERNIEYYSLDVIISVGYRVKSKRGTQFRIWANKILKDYLVKGYAVDQKRFQQQSTQLTELRNIIGLLGNVSERSDLNAEEAKGLFKVITDYSYALDILDRYDHQELEIEIVDSQNTYKIKYRDAINAISGLRDKFGGGKLFGNEKDKSFQSSLKAIYQTYDGKDLYPSIEEKAANLLYFITKNHSFTDGNKRIAAFLFVWFLEKNRILYRSDGSKRIADNALVALTLLIAESKPVEKDVMVKVIVNLINSRN
jgi:prophage maintenance system killer protein